MALIVFVMSLVVLQFFGAHKSIIKVYFIFFGLWLYSCFASSDFSGDYWWTVWWGACVCLCETSSAHPSKSRPHFIRSVPSSLSKTWWLFLKRDVSCNKTLDDERPRVTHVQSSMNTKQTFSCVPQVNASIRQKVTSNCTFLSTHSICLGQKTKS